MCTDITGKEKARHPYEHRASVYALQHKAYGAVIESLVSTLSAEL